LYSSSCEPILEQLAMISHSATRHRWMCPAVTLAR